MTTVTVAIPWRPSPTRIQPYLRACRFWEDMGLHIVTAESDPDKPFNRPQARNRVVSLAPPGIVVIADADTIPERGAVEEAIATVQGEVIWPFDWYRIVPGEYVDVSDLKAAPTITGPMAAGPNCTGGVWVMRTDTYWRLGGQDERFKRWGGEDSAFIAAAATLTGARRIRAECVAFDHVMDNGEYRTPDVDPKLKPLEEAYDRADGDPAAMEALVSDPARGYPAVGVEQWKSQYPSPTPGRHFV